MMKHSDNDECDSYPPPFSLDGGLLSTLRENRKQPRQKQENNGDTVIISPAQQQQQQDQQQKVRSVSDDYNYNKKEVSNNANARQETTVDAALLLASIAEIASKEIVSPPPYGNDDDLQNAPEATPVLQLQTPLVSPVEYNYQQQQGDDFNDDNYNNNSNNNRGRSVSFDTTSVRQIGCTALGPPPALPFDTQYRDAVNGANHNNTTNNNMMTSYDNYYSEEGESPQQSPPQSPHCAGRRPRSVSESSIHHLGLSPTALSSLTLSPSGGVNGRRHHQSSSAKLLLRPSLDRDHATDEDLPRFKTILRKKFSWKNYPELEAFLIANREEYLRHSTLNYTVQQKQYNNRLTERMIELATEHGYVFDEHDFSFVTVRDRIRCYYKSYVQSLKKRGVLIGYAARKAGLIADEELERSAAKAGTIYLPQS